MTGVQKNLKMCAKKTWLKSQFFGVLYPSNKLVCHVLHSKKRTTLFRVVKKSIEQCCAAHIVQCCYT